ncbi:MAG: NAD-dependent epimerase [Planctomycetaceae bacterium]|nr:MAG: NAD-dependent epimerase [Planctomycetaceae bacterium]
MGTHLVTGTAGFIGFHYAARLLRAGEDVVGFDSVNDYYSVSLKRDRLAELCRIAAEPDAGAYHFVEADLADQGAVDKVFAEHRFERVVHLAAQAGVRYSVTHPRTYVQSNLVGFINILEGCRHAAVPHLTYASSSSVYGSNRSLPFSVSDNVDHPLSLYAASKKANELMAHTYSHLYGLPTTGLRFFTVYGPWGRPDMALFLFTEAILAGRPIDVFNHGQMSRDFTYIDDIIEGVYRTSQRIATASEGWSGENPDPATSAAPYRVYNIGNNRPVSLERFIGVIEEKLGRKAVRNLLPMQPGDVPETYADIDALEQAVGFRPETSIEVGVGRFIDWYRGYYGR